MNAVEMEETVSALAEAPFDADEFPFSFLVAFGNKAATVKCLRKGNTDKSDVGDDLLTATIRQKTAKKEEEA